MSQRHKEPTAAISEVDHAAVDRLAAAVAEPDLDELLDLERQEEAQRKPQQAEEPTVGRALVVLVDDNPSDKAARRGSLIAELLVEGGFGVDAVVTVESGKNAIRKALETAVIGGADLVVTVGGVGAGPRDRAPEATRAVLDRKIPGLTQALRSSGLACGATDAGLSRGVSGIAGSTVVVNLTASRAAIRDGMATLLPLARYVINDMQRWTTE